MKITRRGEHGSPPAGGGAAPLEFRHVTKQYPGSSEPAIRDLSFTVPAGEICVLVGPSGCGKTTAMRLVNRMIDLSGGDILIDGTSILRTNPADLRRDIGYVIQQVGLFPHLSIAHNITMVPRLLGWDKRRMQERCEELLELVGLPGDLAGRFPSQLSGGQRQRVGVARALAADPPLMLMDEPFGAIDPINRERLQSEFLRLQSEIRKTIVFVTHDIDEAIKMGDRIAILREGGELVQYDTPDRILADPADSFVARFVGSDRGLKRLALTSLGDVDLPAPPLVSVGQPVDSPPSTDWDEVVLVDQDRRPLGTVRRGSLTGGTVDQADARPLERVIGSDATMRDALSLMMTDSLRPLVVLDSTGRVAGYVTIELINRSLGPAPRSSAPEPEGLAQA